MLAAAFGVAVPAWAFPAPATPPVSESPAARPDAGDAERRAAGELAAALARKDAGAEAAARLTLGQIALREGRHADAMRELEAALPLAENDGDAVRLGAVLATLGIVFDLSGLRAEALQVTQRALALYSGLGDWTRASAMLTNLGNIFDNQGDRDAAGDHYRRALEMKRAHGIRRGTGSVLNNLAAFELDAGRAAAAAELLRQAIQAHREDGNAASQSLAHSNLARAIAQQGEYAAALREVEAARDLSGAEAVAGIVADTAQAEVLLARAKAQPWHRDASLAQALGAVAAARAAARSLEDDGRLAALARLQADIQQAQGQHAAALDSLREAETHRASESRRADAERYALLAARYQSDRQLREIERLREREDAQRRLLDEQRATQAAELGRQRGWALALGFALLGLALPTGLMWRRARERQAEAQRLEAGNRALAAALAEAERQRGHADATAAVNRRLLHLAGEEMRAPLLTLRSGAERLLVAGGDPETDPRRVAGMAEAAGELLRVADQMLESARLDPHAGAVPRPVALERLLPDLVEQLQARAQSRARAVVLRRSVPATVMADAARLQHALQELVELLLRAAPAGSEVELDLARDAQHAQIRIGDPGARLPAHEDELRRNGDAEGGGRLGFAWAREVLVAFGGEVRIAPDARTRRMLLVRLPLAPGATSD